MYVLVRFFTPSVGFTLLFCDVTLLLSLRSPPVPVFRAPNRPRHPEGILAKFLTALVAAKETLRRATWPIVSAGRTHHADNHEGAIEDARIVRMRPRLMVAGIEAAALNTARNGIGRRAMKGQHRLLGGRGGWEGRARWTRGISCQPLPMPYRPSTSRLSPGIYACKGVTDQGASAKCNALRERCT